MPELEFCTTSVHAYYTWVITLAYNMAPQSFCPGIHIFNALKIAIAEWAASHSSVFSSLAEHLDHTLNMFTAHQPNPAQNTELLALSRAFLWCPSLQQPTDLQRLSYHHLRWESVGLDWAPFYNRGPEAKGIPSVWILSLWHWLTASLHHQVI